MPVERVKNHFEEEANIIKRAKNSFNRALSVPMYNDILKDDEQLENIINALKIAPNGKILDLGTGTGYLAFPLAERFPDCEVIGLDVADAVVASNNERAGKYGINNLHFISYNGIDLPPDCEALSSIITRYALHHFPNIDKTFGALGGFVKPDGQIFISDPTPNEDDENRIVDKFMRVKDDGHIKFYNKEEFESLLQKYGFKTDACFYSEMNIAFPEKEEYLHITSTIDQKMRESYDIKIIDGRVHLKLKILNISFIKSN